MTLLRLSRYAVRGSAVLGLSLAAQTKPAELRVVGADGQAIAYANVSVNSGAWRIADKDGRVALGVQGPREIKLSVRRIGFEPFQGAFSVADTGGLYSLALQGGAAKLGTVMVTAKSPQPDLDGFYRRALERERGALTGTFLTPEFIEARNPERASDLLRGVQGVSLGKGLDNSTAALGSNGLCALTVLIDGQRVHSGNPGGGGTLGGTSISNLGKTKNKMNLDDSNAVILEHYVTGGNVLAMEIYHRGGNIPTELQQFDQGCGLLAIWTGKRK